MACRVRGRSLMGFGGSACTRDYAMAQIRYAVSVGVKRFVDCNCSIGGV